MRRIDIRRIKGHEYRYGESFKKVDDDYMIWYDALIGMTAMWLVGIAIGCMIGFIIWS